MSLKKKICIGFLIGGGIIAMLVILGHIGYMKIKKEIAFLETTDMIRTKSLQLRRHEKNFFLYRQVKEIENVYKYLKELREVLRETKSFDSTRFKDIENKVNEYSIKFNRIETLVWEFQDELSKIRRDAPQYTIFYPLIEFSSLENPKLNAELLEKLSPKYSKQAILKLKDIDAEINALRRTGEEIITFSKELDLTARSAIDGLLYKIQIVNIAFSLIFIVVGIGMFFYVANDIISRLRLLTEMVEKTGEKGPAKKTKGLRRTANDEVDILIEKFQIMEEQLIFREKELLQSKKLSAIGRLASGVAHELNNPINNIYLAAQILSKESKKQELTEIIRDTINDIFFQTLRVKQTVGELLAFARERTPDLKVVNLPDVIRDMFKQLRDVGGMQDVQVNLNAPERLEIQADRAMLEQAFFNIFNNAVDAMNGKGLLSINIRVLDESVVLEVSDTGMGISPENITRVFEPFFTTKEKGTGLGLAIVYNVIEKHKGKIEIKSAIGEGTTFTVTLPKERNV